MTAIKQKTNSVRMLDNISNSMFFFIPSIRPNQCPTLIGQKGKASHKHNRRSSVPSQLRLSSALASN